MSRILVLEAIAGGVLAAEPLAPSLLAEGRLMLEGLLRDVSALPGIEVVTTRDARVTAAGWPDVETHVVGPERPAERVLAGLLRRSAAALVVAPESGRLLERLVRRIERAGVLRLGASADAVRVAADKGAAAARLAAAGLPTPHGLTVPADAPVLARAAARLGFPVAIKPVDGAGALGATRAQGPGDLAGALRRVAAGTPAGAALPQVRVERWVDGTAASVALLADGRRAAPLALSAQRIAVGDDGALAYAGGAAPLEHPLRAAALEAASRAALALPGLAGWVGVDLVLPEAGPPVVVEVNPRLTTAYAGLRLVSPVNLAGLLLDACRDRRLPEAPLALTGRAVWTNAEARTAPAAGDAPRAA